MSQDAGKCPAGWKCGDDKADKGDASEGEEDVSWLDDYRVVFDYKVAGHADDTDVLLDETQDDADDKKRDDEEEKFPQIKD